MFIKLHTVSKVSRVNINHIIGYSPLNKALTKSGVTLIDKCIMEVKETVEEIDELISNLKPRFKDISQDLDTDN